MINESTALKLQEMKLTAMADEFERQSLDQDCAVMSFEDRLGLMVDHEYSRRKSNRLARRIKNATLPLGHACVEDIEYHADRKLNKSLIQRLASGTYITEKMNVGILGATGAGKTYISNALGISACRAGFAVKYVRLHDMLSELIMAREGGNYSRLLKQYRNVALLIIDEWLLFEINDEEVRTLLDIIDYRTLTGATIFCSQYGYEGWHQRIGEPIIADAICDRIINKAYTIEVFGKDSMRKKKAKEDNNSEKSSGNQ